MAARSSRGDSSALSPFRLSQHGLGGLARLVTRLSCWRVGNLVSADLNDFSKGCGRQV